MFQSEPGQQDYARERAYQQALLKHSQDFDQLLSSVPEDRNDIRNVMKLLYHTEPSRLLDPEKLAALKRDNPSLFAEVSRYHLSFLQKMEG